METTFEISFAETVIGLLKIIAWLLGGFGVLALTAVGYYFMWKHEVDKKIREGELFQKGALDQMEEGQRIMEGHTTALGSITFRLEQVERKNRGINNLMRDLIRKHNDCNPTKPIDVPPLEI